jgi:hypothetical protein
VAQLQIRQLERQVQNLLQILGDASLLQPRTIVIQQPPERKR